jgi:adenylate cyclase class 2
MKEVEAKAKIDSFDGVKKKLNDLGCEFSEPLVQDDKIYLPNGEDIGNPRKGLVAMRIRNSNGAHIFNMKIQRENDLDNTEYESEVSNPDAIDAMLKNLEYYVASHVNKKRIKCKYKDMEICLDEVKDLGSFIEAEKLTEDEDSAKVQKELFGFLMSIGVKKENQVTKGYDILMYEKNNSTLSTK